MGSTMVELQIRTVALTTEKEYNWRGGSPNTKGAKLKKMKKNPEAKFKRDVQMLRERDDIRIPVSKSRKSCGCCGRVPIFNTRPGFVHLSHHTCLLPIDGHLLKTADPQAFCFLLDFHFNCLRNCALELFHHPGDDRPGGDLDDILVCSYTGKELEGVNVFYEAAEAAINQYNNLSKKSKLKLESLKKINFVHIRGLIFYLTFSAIELETGQSGTYQAAVAAHYAEFVLGLLRDESNDKILAILSITGVEEDLAAKKSALEAYKGTTIEALRMSW